MRSRYHSGNVLGFGAFGLRLEKIIAYASMDHTFIMLLHEYVPFLNEQFDNIRIDDLKKKKEHEQLSENLPRVVYDK